MSKKDKNNKEMNMYKESDKQTRPTLPLPPPPPKKKKKKKKKKNGQSHREKKSQTDRQADWET